MPGSRLAKTMSEKKEVVTWIEEHRERQDSLPVTKIGTSVAMTSMEHYFAASGSLATMIPMTTMLKRFLENLDEFTIWDSEDSV
ncbi:uncharacterized protein IUM83_09900 [Phytophthora cinnamomi]|uniref:uncharacterized protein n=1 Tax=Phytophthora cinnamomi TaxID=4785 RepID=UPI003559FECC|nr:hypothetical protein IUM83_09047 [Phytophthora cinnamomi]KAG6614282.1 hypothetical protein IUM83_09900 [Phytophthora cinnamomi]